MVRKFWWGQRGERRKIHWVRWDDLCRHKNQGGMGLKDLTLFNEAMLAKLAWRLLHDDSSLFYKVFKARFFPTGTIFDAKDLVSASYAWKSTLKGRDVIQKGALWRVGDGQQIRIWGDNWLPSKGKAKVTPPQIHGQGNSSVAVLINESNKSWRSDVIDHVFEPTEAAIIKGIPLCSFRQRDKFIWPFTPSGQYTMKSGYRFLYEGSAPT